MSDISSGIALFEGVKIILKEIAAKLIGPNTTVEDRANLAEAIHAIQKALIRTSNELSKNGYSPNDEITGLWLEAQEKSIKANLKRIPSWFSYKAQYWNDPSSYLDEPEAKKLVPHLEDIRESVNQLINKVS